MDSHFKYKNWDFSISKSSITSEMRKEKICRQFSLKTLPEMFFGDSSLEIRHNPSGKEISLNSTDAMRFCGEIPNEYKKTKVKASANWMKKTDSLRGEIDFTDINYDWTFSTCYKGSLSSNMNVENTKDIIDIELLKKKDKIFWYGSAFLFEDELHDNGKTILYAKIRVMDNFFFVLMRLFIRIDDVLFRVHETRLFHEFGKDSIVREFRRYQKNFKDFIDSGIEREKLFRMKEEEIVAKMTPTELITDKIFI